MKLRFVLPFGTLCLGVVLGIVGSYLVIVRPQWQRTLAISHKLRAMEGVQSTQSDERVVIAALEAYKKDTASFPQGSNAQIMAALRGGSPSKKFYFAKPERCFDAEGNFVDAWGVPYEISFGHDQAFVQSAGPDRRGWTDDDIYAKSH